MKLVWLVMGLFVPLISPSQAQQPNGVTITSLLSTTVTASGRPIVLPQKDVQVAVSKYVVAPGVALAEHEHPYPRFAYVLSGTLRVTNTENRRTYSYKPGDSLWNPWTNGIRVKISGLTRSSCWSSMSSRKTTITRAT